MNHFSTYSHVRLYVIAICSLLFLITGCQNNTLKYSLDEQQKIYIHETTKNYSGLIELYKTRLKQNDTELTRYKLAQAYYLSNDFDSAKRVLKPIISTSRDDHTLVLYGRVEAKLGQYQQALVHLEQALTINPKNGEGYNLKGIVLIKMKQYDAARYAFIQARDTFYDENKVINNLAMLSILNQEYAQAYKQLNVLYNKGYRNRALLHNILYTLVKLDHEQLAKTFCIEHKLSQNPTILIQELKQIEPINTIKFNEIVPEQEKNQKQFSFEKIAEQQKQLTADPTTAQKPIIVPKAVPKNSVAKTQSTIVAVRSGEHPTFSRITLETTHKLDKSHYLIEQLSPTKFRVTLYDVTLPAGGINYIKNRILNSNRDFLQVNTTLTAEKTLVIDIQTKRNSIVKDFYAGLSAKQKGHCFALDFYSINK